MVIKLWWQWYTWKWRWRWGRGAYSGFCWEVPTGHTQSQTENPRVVWKLHSARGIITKCHAHILRSSRWIHVKVDITSKNVSPLTVTHLGWVLSCSLPIFPLINDVFLHSPNSMTLVGILLKLEKNEQCHYNAPSNTKKEVNNKSKWIIIYYKILLL